jgi:hypothetical protein
MMKPSVKRCSYLKSNGNKCQGEKWLECHNGGAIRGFKGFHPVARTVDREGDVVTEGRPVW